MKSGTHKVVDREGSPPKEEGGALKMSDTPEQVAKGNECTGRAAGMCTVLLWMSCFGPGAESMSQRVFVHRPWAPAMSFIAIFVRHIRGCTYRTTSFQMRHQPSKGLTSPLMAAILCSSSLPRCHLLLTGRLVSCAGQVVAMHLFRGKPLTWEVADQLFIGWLGSQVPPPCGRFPTSPVSVNIFRGRVPLLPLHA